MTAAKISEISARAAHPAVVVRSARLALDGLTILDELDITLAGGQWTCLLGASGIVKTTLLKMIAGLVPVDEGLEISCDDGSPLANRVAYMGQQDLLFPWLTVLDNVLIGYRLRGDTDPANVARAMDLLQRVGMAGQAKDLPAACSGGMRQHVALVRTLLEDRPIVLLDEPFCTLDAITRVRVQELAAELLAGRTVLLVTHDPLEALRLGHQVVVMSGSPAKLEPALTPPGTPPRNPEDPVVLAQQGRILRRLAAAGAI